VDSKRRLPKFIAGKKRIADLTSSVAWTLPTHRNETRKDILALRAHIRTAIEYAPLDEQGAIGIPRLEIRGREVVSALGALAYMALRERDANQDPALQQLQDDAAFLALKQNPDLAGVIVFAGVRAEYPVAA
jgi:hypothetical protein